MPIKLVILDIDGVMTDGTKVYDTSANVVAKRFNDRDFTAIKRFLATEVYVCFLSGDENVNKEMAKKRNIVFYHARIEGNLGKENFLPLFRTAYKVTNEEMAYIGDDIFDIPIMKEVGLSLCPMDAISDVRAISNIVLNAKGGEGVVAEAYRIMSHNGHVPKWKEEDFSKLLYIDRREK